MKNHENVMAPYRKGLFNLFFPQLPNFDPYHASKANTHEWIILKRICAAILDDDDDDDVDDDDVVVVVGGGDDTDDIQGYGSGSANHYEPNSTMTWLNVDAYRLPASPGTSHIAL